MKVGVDARALSGPRGIGRYARGLLAALTERFPADEFHVVRHPGDTLPDLPGLVAHPDRRPRRAVFTAAALTGRPRLDHLLGGDLDVLWLPAPAPVAVSRSVPVLLTVHDLSFEQRPGDFTPYERLWHRLARPGRLLHRADRIVADSAATQAVLLARHRLAVDRVEVVHPGLRAPSAPAPQQGDGPPYLLWVGALEPRKAPEVLARAFAAARADGLQAELRVVGDGRSPLQGAGIRRLGRVDDDELDALYRDALAVVTPSRDEGFGFPPLEAALHGTPAVVSDLPVFRETLGDAALRVPAGDTVALGAALLRIERDAALREDLGTRARAAAARFTWAAAADATHAALVRTAEGRR